jgi:hypothetical protein
MKHPIPRSALEHHLPFVGKTGSAKAGSAKSSIVEPETRRRRPRSGVSTPPRAKVGSAIAAIAAVVDCGARGHSRDSAAPKDGSVMFGSSCSRWGCSDRLDAKLEDRPCWLRW